MDARDLFSRSFSDLWLEIGFGSGEHLAWQAAANPEIAIVGCEPYLPGVAALLRHVAEDGLENVRVLDSDVRPLLWRLRLGSVGRAFILFPDPWPKVRHHRRRIVAPVVLDRLALAMRGGAELRIATDDMGYLRWILFHVLGHKAFEWLASGPSDWRRRPADWPPTRYEQKALRQGRNPAYLRFRRRSDGSA